MLPPALLINIAKIPIDRRRRVPDHPLRPNIRKRQRCIQRRVLARGNYTKSASPFTQPYP